MIMPEYRWYLKTVKTPILIYLLLIMILCLSGCVRPEAGFTVRPESFRQPPDVYANESTSDVILSVGDTMMVSYPWTPEDGRYWRVSVTEGLFVTGDRYTTFPPGIQTFVGYLRPRNLSWNLETIQHKITVTVL